MAAITTRETSGGGATVKNSPLTNAELDTNFININTELETKAVFPSLTGNNGKFLTTDGTSVSWAFVSLPAGQTSGSTSSGYLQYSGTTSTAGQINGGTTNPTGTTRLNYNGNFYPTALNLVSTADTTTAATHYFVETASDGFIRPKTLANVQTELVTAAALNNAAVAAGSTTVSVVKYNGNTTQTGQFDGGTVVPSATTRLNYNGYLYATRFYGDGSQLTGIALPAGQTAGSATSGYLQYSGNTVTAGQINGSTTAPTNATRLNYEGNLHATNFIGSARITSLKENRVALGSGAIDLSLGNYFSRTITATTTFSVSNVPTTGTSICIILDLTNAGSFTINWWAGMKWPLGAAPLLTATGRDVLGFFTHDGGITWSGFVLGRDIK
jgi:hypothetical protein